MSLILNCGFIFSKNSFIKDTNDDFTIAILLTATSSGVLASKYFANIYINCSFLCSNSQAKSAGFSLTDRRDRCR